MSEKNNDLDSELESLAVPIKKKIKKEEGESSPLTGIVVNVNGEVKDISECTGEEFVTWVESIFPCKNLDPRDYEKHSSKVKATNNIIRYFSETYIWTQMSNIIN